LPEKVIEYQNTEGVDGSKPAIVAHQDFQVSGGATSLGVGDKGKADDVDDVYDLSDNSDED
jgi:hypothetical protein